MKTFSDRYRPAALVFFVLILTAACASGHVTAEEAELIAEALRLRPGMVVADVGAGSGGWSVDIARRVGETGHVYATEVDDDDLDEIRDRIEREELDNVTAVQGDAHDTGLAEDCCDAILLRLVYHHFTDPEPMRASLRRALRPGGLLVVVEIETQEDWHELPGVPDRGGHGIHSERLIAELTGDGFRVVTRHPEWHGEDDHYCIVFQEATAAAGSASKSSTQVGDAKP